MVDADLEICDRGFGQQGRLRSHLMTHTGIKHLRCLLCTKAYSSRKSLRRHLVGMHAVPIEHPDYKQCFYAMTPEEAGLALVDTQPTLRLRNPRDGSGSGSGPVTARGGTRAETGGGTGASQSNNPTAADSDSGSMPLLQPKEEPESADSGSGSDGKSGSSSEDDDDDDSHGPPQLERQEPFESVTVNKLASAKAWSGSDGHVPVFPTETPLLPLRQVPFSGIRTKAARKQLPLNILVRDNNKLKSRGRPLKVDKAKSPKKTRKARAPKEAPASVSPQASASKPDSTSRKVENGGGRVTRQVSPRGSFFEGFDLDDSLSSSDSDSPKSSKTLKKGRGRRSEEDSWRPGKWKTKKKSILPKKASELHSADADAAPQPEMEAEPSEATDVSHVPAASLERAQPAKSNRRARYKLQNPKKRVLPQQGEVIPQLQPQLQQQGREKSRSTRRTGRGEPQLQGTWMSQGKVCHETDDVTKYHYSNGNDKSKKVKLENVHSRSASASELEIKPEPEMKIEIEEGLVNHSFGETEADPADVAAMVFDYCGRTNSSSSVRRQFNLSTGYVQESA